MAELNLGIGSRVQHPKWGVGVVTGVRFATYLITFVDYDTKEFEKTDDMVETLQAENVTEEITTHSEVEKSLVNILRMWGAMQENVPLGEKWKNGTLVIKSGDPSIKPKEVPIDVFFHKIVMLRDRLRVLEQNINSNPKLTDEDKVNLQQYITRIYGSLTTFNILFKNKEQQFVGEKEKKTNGHPSFSTGCCNSYHPLFCHIWHNIAGRNFCSRIVLYHVGLLHVDDIE